MSVNRYTYGLGDPLGMWDPDGRSADEIEMSYCRIGEECIRSTDERDIIEGLVDGRANMVSGTTSLSANLAMVAGVGMR